jgi:AmiR/NasT family two-component response regulator
MTSYSEQSACDRGNTNPQDPFEVATTGYLADALDAAERRIENLEAALVNARKIGAAVGIVMATQKLTYAQAFAALSAASQQGNEKLRNIAERVLITGSAAPWPH